jgi:uncharacterized protein
MGIQHLRATAKVEKLESWGTVGVPLSSPACELHGFKPFIPGCDDADAGVWECSPGKFRRQVTAGELMHILSGRCTFTPDDGAPLEIAAGDTLFFPPQTSGVWDILETVRKVYALLH